MTQTLVKTIADFSTTLVSKTAVGDTTATLTSATDDDGVAIPTGTYAFTIDRSNSSKEYFTATLTGTALTNIKHITRGTGAATTGFNLTHRKGAEVIISDHGAIKRMMNVLDGTTDLDSGTPLAYDGAPTFSYGNNELVTWDKAKDYTDGVAVAGAPNADLTTKGIVEIATTSEINAGTSTGGTGASIAVRPDQLASSNYGTQLPTSGQKSALVGDNTDIAVGSGNKYVTQTGLQHNAEKYAADAGANDTYVITLSPVPTSYTNGMVVYFKANTANTGAATLNVNSLGAKTIVKGVNTTLVDGDIAAGQFCTVIYDGTNFVLQNQVANTLAAINYKSGSSDGVVNTNIATGGTDTITHNLGVIPRLITLTVANESSIGAAGSTFSVGSATVSSGGTILSQQFGYFSQHSLTFNANRDGSNICIAGGNGSWTSAALANVTSTTFDVVWPGCSYTVNGTPRYVWTVQS